MERECEKTRSGFIELCQNKKKEENNKKNQVSFQTNVDGWMDISYDPIQRALPTTYSISQD